MIENLLGYLVVLFNEVRCFVQSPKVAGWHYLGFISFTIEQDVSLRCVEELKSGPLFACR